MSTNLPQVQPPERDIIPLPEKKLMRVWGSLKADVQFCVHAVRQENAERRWYKIVSTTFNRMNKFVSTVVGSSILTSTIALIYTNRDFLLNNKRWVAIVLLSLLTFFLMWVALTVRRFHERVAGELNARITDLTNLLPARDETIALLLKKLAASGAHLDNKNIEARHAKQKYEHEISNLKRSNKSLGDQLQKLLEYKLFLIVHTESFPDPRDPWETLTSEVSLYYDIVKVDPLWVSHTVMLKAHLVFFLENRANEKAVIRTLRLSLLRRTSRGRDKKVRLSRQLSIELSPITSAPLSLDGYSIDGMMMTPTFILHGYAEMSQRIARRLNQNCFLRLSMDAMNQSPFDIDLDVDWEKARNTSSAIPVTPRK